MAWLKSFLTSILMSLFVSVLIFIGTVSAITGRFPPDWHKVAATIGHLQKALSVSQKMMSQINWEQMEEKLSQNPGGLPINAAGEGTALASADLTKKVTELEIDNAHLRTRIDDLEKQVTKLNYFLSTPTGAPQQ